jgi:hypothetical protein
MSLVPLSHLYPTLIWLKHFSIRDPRHSFSVLRSQVELVERVCRLKLFQTCLERRRKRIKKGEEFWKNRGGLQRKRFPGEEETDAGRAHAFLSKHPISDHLPSKMIVFFPVSCYETVRAVVVTMRCLYPTKSYMLSQLSYSLHILFPVLLPHCLSPF